MAGDVEIETIDITNDVLRGNSDETEDEKLIRKMGLGK
jgi:hypothetical protein